MYPDSICYIKDILSVLSNYFPPLVGALLSVNTRIHQSTSRSSLQAWAQHQGNTRGRSSTTTRMSPEANSNHGSHSPYWMYHDLNGQGSRLELWRVWRRLLKPLHHRSARWEDVWMTLLFSLSGLTEKRGHDDVREKKTRSFIRDSCSNGN